MNSSSPDHPLVLVSNRGPVTFGPGDEVHRGTGGLVTALIGLATHRDVTWVASAMTDEDVMVAERHEGRPFPVSTDDGHEYGPPPDVTFLRCDGRGGEPPEKRDVRDHRDQPQQPFRDESADPSAQMRQFAQMWQQNRR